MSAGSRVTSRHRMLALRKSGSSYFSVLSTFLQRARVNLYHFKTLPCRPLSYHRLTSYVLDTLSLTFQFRDRLGHFLSFPHPSCFPYLITFSQPLSSQMLECENELMAFLGQLLSSNTLFLHIKNSFIMVFQKFHQTNTPFHNGFHLDSLEKCHPLGMKLPLTGPFLPARTISQSTNNCLNNKDESFQLCAGIILIVFSILNHVIITKQMLSSFPFCK